MTRRDDEHAGSNVGNAEGGGGDGPVRPSVPEAFKLGHEVAHDGHALAVGLEEGRGGFDEHPGHGSGLDETQHLLELGGGGIFAPGFAPGTLHLRAHHRGGEKVHVRGEGLDHARVAGLADALETRREDVSRAFVRLRLKRNLVASLRQTVIQDAASAEQGRHLEAPAGVRLGDERGVERDGGQWRTWRK